MSEQIEKLSGKFTPEQITVLLEVFASQEDIESLADLDEKADQDHEHRDLEERLDDLEETCDKYDLRSMERSIEDLSDKVSALEDVELPQPTTFKEVWQMFLAVMKLKFQSLRG
jgi:polyhydroxyalkanoate synthesis regulator phasin